jgi:hypothetical protein
MEAEMKVFVVLGLVGMFVTLVGVCRPDFHDFLFGIFVTALLLSVGLAAGLRAERVRRVAKVLGLAYTEGMTNEIPGKVEHPDTTCIECGRPVTWILLAGDSDMAYIDDMGFVSCQDRTGHQFEHEPIGAANDGILWQKELDEFLANR